MNIEYIHREYYVLYYTCATLRATLSAVWLFSEASQTKNNDISANIISQYDINYKLPHEIQPLCLKTSQSILSNYMKLLFPIISTGITNWNNQPTFGQRHEFSFIIFKTFMFKIIWRTSCVILQILYPKFWKHIDINLHYLLINSIVIISDYVKKLCPQIMLKNHPKHLVKDRGQGVLFHSCLSLACL